MTVFGKQVILTTVEVGEAMISISSASKLYKK
jgi:hypothetical protein